MQSSRLKPLLQNLTDPSAAPAFEPATSPPCGKDTVRRPPMSAYRKSPEAIARLTPVQYRVTQESATERPGTGEHLHTTEPGIYVDIVSGEPLFASSSKFESGCGWPSFSTPIVPAHVNEVRDSSHGMIRTEVRSVHGDSHLRSEEHTSELQSLMRISYAVFC